MTARPCAAHWRLHETTRFHRHPAPGDTPREIVTRYNTISNEILRMPQVKEKITTLGLTGVGGTPEHFGEANAKALVKWQKVSKEARVTDE